MCHAKGTARMMRTQGRGMLGVFKDLKEVDCHNRMSKEKCDGKDHRGQIVFHFFGFYKNFRF